jgi:hypothetical protein
MRKPNIPQPEQGRRARQSSALNHISGTFRGVAAVDNWIEHSRNAGPRSKLGDDTSTISCRRQRQTS